MPNMLGGLLTEKFGVADLLRQKGFGKRQEVTNDIGQIKIDCT